MSFPEFYHIRRHFGAHKFGSEDGLPLLGEFETPVSAPASAPKQLA
jgi:hypothetical protein